MSEARETTGYQIEDKVEEFFLSRKTLRRSLGGLALGITGFATSAGLPDGSEAELYGMIGSGGLAMTSAAVAFASTYMRGIKNSYALQAQHKLEAQDIVDEEIGQSHLFDMERTLPDYAKQI